MEAKDEVPREKLVVMETGEGVAFQVLVQPRAARNELAGLQQGALKIRLTAPPVEGEANDACIRYVAGLLGVPRSSVDILRGRTSRKKTLRVRGLPPQAVQKLLTDSPPS